MRNSKKKLYMLGNHFWICTKTSIQPPRCSQSLKFILKKCKIIIETKLGRVDMIWWVTWSQIALILLMSPYIHC